MKEAEMLTSTPSWQAVQRRRPHRHQDGLCGRGQTPPPEHGLVTTSELGQGLTTVDTESDPPPPVLIHDRTAR